MDGDITEPDLGLARPRPRRRRVTEIYHLAAIYDLTVTRRSRCRSTSTAPGTCSTSRQSCPPAPLPVRQHLLRERALRRPFAETDLDEGQTFNNFYEETKYLAEVEVRDGWPAGLPATIYRPAIVVGDSRTGDTQKYDGPYFAIQWLLRQPRIAIMPVVGDPTSTRFNVVPRDFVVDAIAA